MVRLLFLTLISALLPFSLATSFVSLIQTRQNSSASASDLNSSSPETRKLAVSQSYRSSPMPRMPRMLIQPFRAIIL